MAENQVIKDDRLMPSGDELPHAMTPDVTGATDNKYVHGDAGVLI
ncbi:MAG TPA: hypothetical protein VGA56_09875 [Opitutaceae bacterium]